MKTPNLFILFLFSCLITSTTIYGQDTAKVKAIINRGIALHDSAKYSEAIDKYKEALKLDPGNLHAQYEMSFTMVSSGRQDEAIPVLEKVCPSNEYAEAYDLLASIYDDKKDYTKALAIYKQGLAAFPKYQRLYFNLGISYLRQEKYPEAEENAIKAITLNPKHASSQRLYALAMYHRHRDVASIMAFCSFLMLEPQTNRSAEAYQYIQKIFLAGVKVDTVNGKKSITITVQDNKAGDDDFGLQTMVATLGASSYYDDDKNKNQSGIDILNDQLTSIFKVAGEIQEKKKHKDFFWKYYAEFFYKLTKTDNMPAFIRLVSLSGYHDENLKWFKENDYKLKALSSWVASAKRETGE